VALVRDHPRSTVAKTHTKDLLRGRP
jgi:hypothetical protein